MALDPHQKLIASMVAEFTEDERDEYEERAAINQFVNHMTRDNANILALQHVLKKKRK